MTLLHRLILTGPLTLALAAGSSLALAALGGVPHNPEPKRAETVSRLAASSEKTHMSETRYTVHQTVLPTGTRVEEFALPGGKVFAVTWDGPVLPDWRLFFGDSYPAFEELARKKRQSGVVGGALVSQQPELVVVSRGRMGSFSGHAYLPARVPTGLAMSSLLP